MNWRSPASAGLGGKFIRAALDAISPNPPLFTMEAAGAHQSNAGITSLIGTSGKQLFIAFSACQGVGKLVQQSGFMKLSIREAVVSALSYLETQATASLAIPVKAK